MDWLGQETEQGYQGTFKYVQALHCIFQDTFYRCGLPEPPRLNLHHAMMIRSDGVDAKSRMRSFNGYKYRAFDIVQAVIDNPIAELDDSEEVGDLDITPVTQRRQYPGSPDFQLLRELRRPERLR